MKGQHWIYLAPLIWQVASYYDIILQSGFPNNTKRRLSTGRHMSNFEEYWLKERHLELFPEKWTTTNVAPRRDQVMCALENLRWTFSLRYAPVGVATRLEGTENNPKCILIATIYNMMWTTYSAAAAILQQPHSLCSKPIEAVSFLNSKTDNNYD